MIYIKYIKIVKNPIKTIAHTELLTVVQAPQRGLSPAGGLAVSRPQRGASTLLPYM